MATRIALMCLLWAAGVLARYDEDGWYGRSSNVGPASYEDRMLSYEEASEEYYPVKQQRYMRSSRYTPDYGYGNQVQQDSGDWERYSTVSTRKPPRQEAPKARRKYDTYGKSSRTGSYSYKSSLDVNGYERRKTSRAAPRSYPGESASYGKTTLVTFKAVPPKPNCAQNLLIGCTPTVTRVPCSASLPYEAYGGGVPYYPPPPPPPMYHQAPPVHYSHPPVHYGHPTHPAVYPGYQPHAPSYYPPPPAASSHGYPKPPTAPGAYSHTAEGSGYEHGPSYKAATQEDVPGFAAPVQEALGESPKTPIISAFHKPTADGTAAGAKAAAVGSPAVNGTMEQPPTGAASSSTANPMPVLTTTTAAHGETSKEFWGGDEDAESSTDATETSTAR